MSTYKDLAVQYLKEKEIHCNDYDDYAFNVIFSGDNCSEIKIVIAFNEEAEDNVYLKCYSVSNANFNGKEGAGLALCNDLNSRYRWVKFYLTDNCDISVIIEGIVEPETCGSEVYRLLMLIVGIIDEAYPDIMRTRFA